MSKDKGVMKISYDEVIYEVLNDKLLPYQLKDCISAGTDRLSERKKSSVCNKIFVKPYSAIRL